MDTVAPPSATFAQPPAREAHRDPARRPDPAARTGTSIGAAERPDARAGGAAAGELSEAELEQLRELKARDREVRAHERAHAAAAGSLARGGPSYTTQRGPDGRMYAVGGEVQIDTSAVPGDPQATLQKALRIQRAALAPATPSAQDRAVAASAAAMAATARLEIAREAARNRADGASAEATTESGMDARAAEPERGACPVCGSAHRGEPPQEAVSRHFRESVTPAPRGGLLAVST